MKGIYTIGDLMDIANMKGNRRLKDALRDHFKSWCEKAGKSVDPFDCVVVEKWRNQPVGKEDAGLIMIAFGISQ